MIVSNKSVTSKKKNNKKIPLLKISPDMYRIDFYIKIDTINTMKSF